jgi:SAM-dependent methyltransferase
VANPWTEYDKIYTGDYYAGQGADPLVDYLFELEHPHDTIRQYEWMGILQIIQSLRSLGPESHWLDFGCGNGGLVRYVRSHSPCRIVGFEEGGLRDQVVAAGIPMIDRAQLDTCESMFDIVTAIEVLEHIVEPLEVLASIRRVLKPGGLFFCTTGNAQPFRHRLLSWRYIVPEIHVSFFEPNTLAYALTRTGFCPEFTGFLHGFSNIIRFKALKNLHRRRPALFERLLPWSVIARLLDFQLKITAHPVGWAITAGTASGASLHDVYTGR